jgi:NADH:ubiquinone oxidoreductase subunit 2 (subunit N)
MEAAVLAGYAWLLVVALVATVLGAIAAARLVRTVFGAEGREGALPLDEPAPARAALTVCGVAVIGLAAAVQPLLALAGGGAGAVIPH